MSSNEWFKKSDIKLSNSVILDDLHGYVLPHASTKYTGHILSHTLRFKPKKVNFVKKIVIIYYPAFEKENIEVGTKKYYHEYFVPWQTMLVALSSWNIDPSKITFIPINVRDTTNKSLLNEINLDNETLFIVSSDFSHFLPFKEAIVKENTAAHALMYKNTDPNFMNNIVDDPRSFRYLFLNLPTKAITLQWIGRTRSPGLKSVGYLSFLIMKQHKVKESKLPDGIFVTCYDTEMRHRECLGTWFNDENKYSKMEENELKNKVIRLGQTKSRLTGGENTSPLIKYYTVSYLYKSQTNNNLNNFIRGWHTILGNATYLSDVFLENTFNNGQWINLDIDKEWKSGKNSNTFDMTETLEQLNLKSHLDPDTPQHEVKLYETFVKNVMIDSNGNKMRGSSKRKRKGNKTRRKK
jgi:hypothetical protein